MAFENLDILFGGEWRKDREDFRKVVDGMVGDIERLSSAAKNFRFDFGNGADFKKSQQESINLLKALTAEVKLLQEQEKLKQAQIINSIKAEKEQTSTLREKLRLIKETRQEQERVEKAMAKENAALAKQQSAYALLNTEYQKRAKAVKDLAVIYGTEDVMVKRAAESANKLGDQLKKIDAMVGQHQRNVGNYASQWNGLNFSIQQMVREVPSTINNLSMLPLALSNNVGTLIDAIKQARVANAALAAEGKATIPVWKQVAGAIFSWQTALMAIIAVIVAYTSASGSAAKKVGELSESVKSASSDYAEARIKIESWTAALQDGSTKAHEKDAILKEYNATLGEHMGKQTSVLGLEQRLTEAGPAYIQAMKHRAIAAAALAASMDILTESMKNQSNGGKDLLTWQDQLKTVFTVSGASKVYAKAKADRLAQDKKDAEDRTKNLEKIINDENKKAEALIGKFNFNFDPKATRDKNAPEPADLTNTIIESQREVNEALKQMELDNLQVKADNAKAIADDEKRSLEERLDYYENYYEKLRQLEQISYDKELEDINLRHEKQKHTITESTATEEVKNKALIAAAESYTAQVNALYEKYELKANDRALKGAKDRQAITESSIKVQLQAILQGAQDIENQVKESEYRKLELLETAKANGLITQEQYEKQRKEIIANSNNDIAAGQRQYYLNEIDDLEKQGKLTKEVADKIRKEIAGLSTSKTGGGNQGGVFHGLVKSIFGDLSDEEVDKIVAAYTQAFNEIYSSIKTIISNKYAAEIQGLENEMDLLKTRYEQEVDYINSLSVTKEEREKRLADLKARNTLKELDQQRRINEVKRRQARAEKTANIAETVGKTAIAVMNALTVKPFYLGLALSVAAGIAGAAQIAAISSTPLPEYYKGRGYGKNEYALVNERGPEAIVNRSGDIRIANEGKEGVTYLHANEKVITADETNEMLKGGALKTLASSGKKVNEWTYMQAMVSETRKSRRDIVSAIERSKPVIHVHNYDNNYTSKIGQH